MRKIKYLIIGAGISGLSVAMQLKEDYLIIEKENRVGGLCKTFYQDGFVWDYAGHFFHFATPEIKSFFEQRIPACEMVKCIKKTTINYNGIRVDYPFQMNIHQLPKDEFIDCLYDLFHREEKKEYNGFEEMLYGKFGKSITEKFLKPYNEKLYACDLNYLDTDAMGRFFPYADPKQIIDNMKKGDVQTYNSMFDYPKLGAQLFIDTIMKEIDCTGVMLNAKVDRIDTGRKVAYVSGTEIQYDYLINTTPLNRFTKIVSEYNNRGVSNKLSCNKVLVFNLGFDRQANNTDVHWTYVPSKKICFYRMGFYSNILGTDKLSMYIEIGFSENEIIDVERQLQKTIIGLKELKVIEDHNLVAFNHLIIDPGYVHITQESIETVAALREELKEKKIYTIGRYGGWTYCSIEDCIVEAINLANVLKKENNK